MKLLTILLLATLLIGCKLTKEERKMNRATNKLEKLVTKFPELKRTDTVYTIIPPQIIHGETILTVDTTKVDSLRQLLASCSDTVYQRVVDFIPELCYIHPINFDNDSTIGRIWIDGGKIMYDIRVKEMEVKTPYETIQPVIHKPTVKQSQITDRWRTVAIVFIAISVVLGLVHWVR